MVIDIQPQWFWEELTPKKIEVYFSAAKEKRKKELQGYWWNGFWCRQGIISSISFSEKSPPPYPEMPFAEEDEEELYENEEWCAKQRELFYAQLTSRFKIKKEQ